MKKKTVNNFKYEHKKLLEYIKWKGIRNSYAYLVFNYAYEQQKIMTNGFFFNYYAGIESRFR